MFPRGKHFEVLRILVLKSEKGHTFPDNITEFWGYFIDYQLNY